MTNSPELLRFRSVAIVLALAVLGFSWETIQANNGLGWDGVFYASGPSFSPYYVGRIVPILLANLIPLSPVWAWRLLNAVCSLASCFLWNNISDRLRLTGGRWLGFCGLFLTFQAKQFYFDPVLVDAFAEMVALAMLSLHLKRDPGGLFVLTVLSSFCWPTAGLTGAALMMFSGKRSERPVRGLWLFLAITLFSFLAYVVCWLLRSPLRSLVTAIPSYALLAAAAYSLIDRYRFRHLWGAAAFALPFTIILAAPKAGGGSPGMILGYIIHPQSGLFFLPFVSLAVYYGPLVLLAGVNWPKVAAASKGLGITLPILIGLPFVLTTEPRHFLFAWPFVVVCVAKALDSFSWKIGVLCVLWSQFWLPINYAKWAPGTADYQHFPKQLWFMHFGFWMSPMMFAIQGALLVATALCCNGFDYGIIKQRLLGRRPAGRGERNVEAASGDGGHKDHVFVGSRLLDDPHGIGRSNGTIGDGERGVGG